MPLSPREQRLLAGIENNLGESDPALTATLTRARLRSSFWQRYPLSARHTCLLLVALLAQIVLSPLALQLGPAGLGMLTALLIVPWLVSASRAGRRNGDDAPTAPRPGSAGHGRSHDVGDPLTRLFRRAGPWLHGSCG
jgi:hypothetical protein